MMKRIHLAFTFSNISAQDGGYNSLFCWVENQVGVIESILAVYIKIIINALVCVGVCVQFAI